MKIEFDLSAKLVENSLALSGNSAHKIEIQATDTISPALAVWQKWEQLKPLHGDKLTIQGPDGFRSSFHYQIAVFIARALIVLQDHHDTKTKIDTPDRPLDKHLPAIRGGGFPDSDLFGHGLAQLASYAQAEWTGAYIPCPLDKRLSSLFIALHRTCDDEVSLYGNGQLGMVAILFRCSLAACSVNNQNDKAIIRALGDLNGAAAAHPSSPRIEGIFDNDDKDGFKLSNHWWLKSLVERLKLDRDAYKRDAARAKKDYSVLAGAQKEIVPVETIRIERPESLLFDLWAWQDYESSKEYSGFPLAWIDNGWYTQGFELRLDPSRRTLLKPLEKQVEGLSLPTPKQTGNAGWSLTYANDPKVRSDVRFRLKRKLFPATADFKACAISLKTLDNEGKATVTSVEWNLSPNLLDRAIRDGESGDEAKIIPTQLSKHSFGVDAYLWSQVEFADIDIYATWAGDEIATILYSLLRPAAGMTLPNDFLEHHVHRSPSMVYAWAREGMVVAYQDNKKTKVALEELKRAINEAATLEGELKDIIKKGYASAVSDIKFSGKGEKQDSPKDRATTAQTTPRKERVSAVVHNHIDLRQRSAQPDLRALRGFLERRHAQEIYDAFRQSEADANQLHTLETMKESSERLDWLEAVLFAFAITEAGHILGEALLPGQWVRITVWASIFGVIGAACFLRLPNSEWCRKHHAEGIGKTILILVFVVIYVVAFVLSWYHPGGVQKPSPLPLNPPISVCTSPGNPPAFAQPIAEPKAAAQPARKTATAQAAPMVGKP